MGPSTSQTQLVKLDDPNHPYAVTGVCDRTCHGQSYNDAFWVAKSGNALVVTRIDANKGWDMDLSLNRPPVLRRDLPWVVGSSKTNRVRLDLPPWCIDTVKFGGLCDADCHGRTDVPDRFRIGLESVDDRQFAVVQRVDQNSGWGMDLVVRSRPK